ncbi:hypothetical protein K440DRAFT_216996 [Wilcoxina mikolae CBS 423.85]|nr:hypothetical protein K440DRAFT_216996 [Wilcoxina mikolae CBS 423.85]
MRLDSIDGMSRDNFSLDDRDLIVIDLTVDDRIVIYLSAWRIHRSKYKHLDGLCLPSETFISCMHAESLDSVQRFLRRRQTRPLIQSMANHFMAICGASPREDEMTDNSCLEDITRNLDDILAMLHHLAHFSLDYESDEESIGGERCFLKERLAKSLRR